MAEATDPANADAFQGQEKPVVDYAEKARRDAMDVYKKQWDTKEKPLNQNGHIWGVTKKRTQ